MKAGKKLNGKSAILGKRWKIWPRLLFITNRKWHKPF